MSEIEIGLTTALFVACNTLLLLLACRTAARLTPPADRSHVLEVIAGGIVMTMAWITFSGLWLAPFHAMRLPPWAPLTLVVAVLTSFVLRRWSVPNEVGHACRLNRVELQPVAWVGIGLLGYLTARYLVVGIAALVGGPWYVRNLALTGRPLYPSRAIDFSQTPIDTVAERGSFLETSLLLSKVTDRASLWIDAVILNVRWVPAGCCLLAIGFVIAATRNILAGWTETKNDGNPVMLVYVVLVTVGSVVVYLFTPFTVGDEANTPSFLYPGFVTVRLGFPMFALLAALGSGWIVDVVIRRLGADHAGAVLVALSVLALATLVLEPRIGSSVEPNDSRRARMLPVIVAGAAVLSGVIASVVSRTERVAFDTLKLRRAAAFERIWVGERFEIFQVDRVMLRRSTTTSLKAT